MSIKVLLVDDDPMVCQGVELILSAAPDIDVIGSVDDGDQVLRAVRESRPDVILLDVRMARQDGLVTMSQLRALPQRPKVIILTTFDTPGITMDSVAAGADGFLVKTVGPVELQQAVRDVFSGSGAMTPSQLPHVFDSVAAMRAEQQAARRTLAVLSERERGVCMAIAAGGTYAEVGARLHLSEATVKTHLASALRKLGVDRTGVIVLITQAGWIAGAAG